MPRKDKAREKSNPEIGLHNQKNRKQLSTFIIIYINIDNKRKGRGGGTLCTGEIARMKILPEVDLKFYFW